MSKKIREFVVKYKYYVAAVVVGVIVLSYFGV